VTDSYAYDATSNVTSISRPLVGAAQVQRTTVGYDDARPGDAIRVTDPNAKAWTMSYNANGDATSLTDPLGNRTTSEYDTVGRLVSQTSPRGRGSRRSV
jgi:YD repeat-containing protein